MAGYIARQQAALSRLINACVVTTPSAFLTRRSSSRPCLQSPFRSGYPGLGLRTARYSRASPLSDDFSFGLLQRAVHTESGTGLPSLNLATLRKDAGRPRRGVVAAKEGGGRDSSMGIGRDKTGASTGSPSPKRGRRLNATPDKAGKDVEANSSSSLSLKKAEKTTKKKGKAAAGAAAAAAERMAMLDGPVGCNGALRAQESALFSELLKGLHGNEPKDLDLPNGADAPVMDAVVKVYCTHTEPNYSLPWQKRRQSQSTGSGFMIAGRRVLTNAHCVDHHTQVKLKRRGDDTKFVARVLAIGVECDIALLTVDDDAFWDGPIPLRFGGLPNLQDAVTVVGYPIGGDTISVTSGVVSRIEVMSYTHGLTELLGVQIDAAVNPGNSGGPTFNDDGECVGIAFQGLSSADAENIGYIIPTPVIYHFLEDYNRNGRYTGFPAIGSLWQALENPAMRTSLGMAPHQKGVLIRRVDPTSPAHAALLPGDVLLRFDGVPVANDGTVPFRTGERVSHKFLVSQKFTGDTARLQILRASLVLEVDVLLKPPKRLIPVHIEGRPPSYFLAAGLVFTPVIEPFLQSEYGQDYDYDTPVPLLHKLLLGEAKYEDEEVVVLCQVLANECSIGYEEIRNAIVHKVNGTGVRNLRHLAHLVDSCSGEFLKFEVGNTQLVVLETAQLKAATAQVLADHSIPSDRSDNLKEGAASWKEPSAGAQEVEVNGIVEVTEPAVQVRSSKRRVRQKKAKE